MIETKLDPVYSYIHLIHNPDFFLLAKICSPRKLKNPFLDVTSLDFSYFPNFPRFLASVHFTPDSPRSSDREKEWGSHQLPLLVMPNRVLNKTIPAPI